MPPSRHPTTVVELQRIREGDRDAFEQFFRAWYPALADHALTVIGAADAADDAVQEVFIALWRGRDNLPGIDTLAAYLHRAVRNRALNQLRGSRRLHEWDETADTASVAPTVQQEMEEAELAERVKVAIALLAPRTREIFLLQREQGYSYREIAVMLDISIKTVETLMGRALRALRTTLSRDREASDR